MTSEKTGRAWRNACGNERECEAVCPKGISIRNIARMNREYLQAALLDDSTA